MYRTSSIQRCFGVGVGLKTKFLVLALRVWLWPRSYVSGLGCCIGLLPCGLVNIPGSVFMLLKIGNS